jgi:hypothetical protein
VALGNVIVGGCLLAALVVPATAAPAPGVVPASKAHAISTRLLLSKLTVGPTYHAGYVRTKFELWTSHPDGCDTRDKVLIRDAVTAPHVRSGCVLTGGRWRSPYDGVTTRNASDVQVDHMVPLAAAWGAGAWQWTSATRREFANDLGTRYDLLAVSGHSNESKSDQSPDQWLPPKTSFDCRYLADYTAVLWRWRLAVDPRQKHFLRRHLRQCGWPKVVAPVRPSIGKHPTGGGGGGRKGQIASGIKITEIAFDPPGDDTGSNTSLDNEWVKVKNTSAKRATLTDWTLKDAVGHLFVFPATQLKPNAQVKVHTGSGHDSNADVFWRSPAYIWNNDGDTATLAASNGKQADRCSYTSAGGSGSTNC